MEPPWIDGKDRQCILSELRKDLLGAGLENLNY
jgi:hypothetical protein